MSIAWANRGGAAGGTNNGTSIAVSVTAQVGDTILVFTGATTAAPATSVTDNASPPNSYQSTGENNIWFALNVTHAPTVVTVHWSGGVTESAACVEIYTGVGQVPGTGDYTTGNNATSTSPSVGPAAGPNVNGDWLVMGVIGFGSSTYSTNGANTLRHSAFSAATGGQISCASYDVGPDVLSCTGTLSLSESWAAGGVVMFASRSGTGSGGLATMGCGG